MYFIAPETEAADHAEKAIRTMAIKEGKATTKARVIEGLHKGVDSGDGSLGRRQTTPIGLKSAPPVPPLGLVYAYIGYCRATNSSVFDL